MGSCSVATPVPTLTPVPPTPVPSPTAEWERTGWEIVWHDEFEGTELDLQNWLFRNFRAGQAQDDCSGESHNKMREWHVSI